MKRFARAFQTKLSQIFFITIKQPKDMKTYPIQIETELHTNGGQCPGILDKAPNKWDKTHTKGDNAPNKWETIPGDTKQCSHKNRDHVQRYWTESPYKWDKTLEKRGFCYSYYIRKMRL